MEWLEQKIWPAEARLTDDDVYWGTRLACLEMIRTGTVTLLGHVLATGRGRARAVRDAGLRATVGPPLLDGMDPSRSKAACDEAARHLDELAEYAEWVQPALAPHGIYTASEPTLTWIAEQSAARDVPVHIHFLETRDEVTGCVDRTGERPGRVPRADRPALAASRPRARRLDGSTGARARRRTRRDRRHQSRSRTSSSRSAACSRTRRCARTAYRSASAPTARRRTTRSTCWPTSRCWRSSRSSRRTTPRRCRRPRPGRWPPARSHPGSAARRRSRWGSRPTSCSPARPRPSSRPATSSTTSCTRRRARS